jgi:eukaryotic-like serine/threonine-protein kinase
MFNSVGSSGVGSSPTTAAAAAATAAAAAAAAAVGAAASVRAAASISARLADDVAPRTRAEDLIVELQQTHRIEELIGCGATGDVFKAKNLVLDRYEALKIISAPVSDSGFVHMQRQARALGQAVHQGIVTVYNASVTANGTPYILMEYVDGVPLSRIIEQQTSLNFDWILFTFGQMCFAMDRAHAVGIIHRDLKPDNVIVAHGSNGFDTVKIIDFGIARDSVKEQKLATTGLFIGTPLYMSPEQFDGEDVDSRSDIYSLGCVLFEMLTGAPPFEGLTALGLAYQHTYSDPILPEHLRHFQPIIRKAMAKYPGDRYQTAAAMWEELFGAVTSSCWRRPRLLVPENRTIAVANTRNGSIGLDQQVIVFWSLIIGIAWFITLAVASHGNPVFVTLAVLLLFLWVGHIAWVRKVYLG